MRVLNLFLVKRKNPIRYLTTSFTAGQVCNLCSPRLLAQEIVPATQKAQSGCKNDAVLKTQEKAWIAWKKQPCFSTTYHLLDHIWAAKHPQRRAMALPLRTGALWAAGRPPRAGRATTPCHPSASPPAPPQPLRRLGLTGEMTD